VDEFVVLRVLDDDEELPPDVEVEPDIATMENEAAVRHMMEFWGLDEPDARFHVALARGEIDGDAYAVDDNGEPVRTPRPHRSAV
jgi:hypothetical protein